MTDVPGTDLPTPRKPQSPTRREALEGLTRELEAAGFASARTEAERLVALATDLGRSELLLSLGSPLESAEARRLADAVRRRLSGEPLQHIEGTVQFRELVLLSDSRAFIPRPETEQLVDRIAVWARARANAVESEHTSESEHTPESTGDDTRHETGDSGGGVRRVRRPATTPAGAATPSATGAAAAGLARPAGEHPLSSALDIGTGSGAIALSLVGEGLAERVVAIDSSEEALSQATENRDRAGLTAHQVELRLVTGAAWQPVGSEERFDLIVSNPPYVSAAEEAALPPEVRRDPRSALFGGEEGLDVIREIVEGAWAHLEPGGALFLEIGDGQGELVRPMLEGAGRWAALELGSDLAGMDRFAFAARPSSDTPEE